ncbi:MAG: hypothetical protein ACOC4E_00755 [Patescibacteria group bacterium]
MTIVIVTVSYLFILFSVLSGWWLLAAAMLLFVSWRWSSLPVLVLGVLLDGYFGFFFTVPLFSFGAAGWCIVVEQLRPIVRDQMRPRET